MSNFMKNKKIFIALAIFIFCIQTQAEGMCPPGQHQTTPPGGQGPIGCAPMPNRSSTSIEWESRWGSIATDGKGTWGIKEGIASKKEAQASALSECRDRGGKNCSLVQTYSNQCASVATNGAKASTVSERTKPAAERSALDRCEKKQRKGWVLDILFRLQPSCTR